jgi:hypothetical protein
MFELSAIGNKACGWSFASKGLNALFCSRIYTSGILTILIVLLIMILYPCKKGTPCLILVKLGFYVFICTYITIFIHDGILHKESNDKLGESKNDNFINSIGSDDVVYGNDNIPVKPNPNVIGGEGIVGDGICCNGGDSSNSSNDVFAMYGV